MSISIEDVAYIAKLARLEFTPAQMEKLAIELNNIITYIDKLNELDTSNVEPLSHVTESVSPLREDRITPSLDREEALKNAPDRTAEFFKVPAAIKPPTGS